MLAKDLQEQMNILVNECENQPENFRTIIAKAVQLGMNFQEQKIKEGINIVFNSLHMK